MRRRTATSTQQAPNGETPGRPSPSLTEALAAFAGQVSAGHLPDRVSWEARRALLDHLAVAIAGGTHPIAQAAATLARQLMPGDGATVLADAGSCSPLGAAFANGVAAHVLELDDLHQEGVIHAGAPVLAAALAAAEHVHATIGMLLTAIVVGYDVAVRIAVAAGPSHYRFWHPTVTCGVFGAAAAAGVLLGLSPSQLVDALGTAGTFASGLWQFLDDDAQSKPLHAGKAAHDGLLAAFLARSSVSGARRILEGPRGFFAATASRADSRRVLDGLGERFLILENGYKRHACCGHTHTAIDAALQLRAQQPLAAIDQVHVETYHVALDMTDCPEPQTERAAKFSLQHAVAVALIDGVAGISQFRPQRVLAQEVVALRRRIRVYADPAFTASYPVQWPARVRIWFADGTMCETTVSVPKGMPGNPFSDAELREKCCALLTETRGLSAGPLADMVFATAPTQPVTVLTSFIRRLTTSRAQRMRDGAGT